MSLRLGDIAPDFEQDSSEGRIPPPRVAGRQLGRAVLPPRRLHPGVHHRAGFHRQAQGPVRPARVKVLALSVDPVESHLKWIDDINETQDTRVNFPIIADADRKVSELYDLIHPNANDTLTVRSLFIIDPNKKVRLIITYPASTGRNFNEILRVIDSLQLTDEHKVATPANWEGRRRGGNRAFAEGRGRDQAAFPQRLPRGEALPAPDAPAQPLRPDSSRLHGQARQAGPLFDGACRHATLFSHEQGFGRFRPAPLLCAPARRRDAFYPPSISETGSDLPARRGEGSLIHLLPGADA